MNDRLPTSDEEFDDFARSAGESLRRPAPAGGPGAVRSARRRQQVARSVAGGAAVALVAIGGTVLVLRNGDGSAITTTTEPPATSLAPDATPDTTPDTAPDVAPEPTDVATPDTTTDDGSDSTVPPETSPPATAPSGPSLADLEPSSAPVTRTAMSAEALAWIDARAADGLGNAQLTRTDGTDAVLIATWADTTPVYRSAVMLPDGRVIDTPAGWIAQPYVFRMFAVGGRPVLDDLEIDGTPVLWVLDPVTGEWSSGPDLGLGLVRGGTPVIGPFVLQVVGDSLIVAVNSSVADSSDVISPAPDRRGVVIHPDLSVTPIAPPPDGVPMSWSTAIGSKALQIFAQNGGSYSIAPVDGHWAYDVATDTWDRIAEPGWLDCPATGCQFTGPFEMGDPHLLAATRRGVVAQLGDTVGLYDPIADHWSRLDDAPLTLSLPATLAMGDQLLVAPMRWSENEYGLVGVLDLTTGAWTTHQIEFSADTQARVDGYFDAGWDVRTDGSVVMLAPSQVQRGTGADPSAVYDPASRTWSTPTADDVDTWRRFPTIYGSENF